MMTKEDHTIILAQLILEERQVTGLLLRENVQALHYKLGTGQIAVCEDDFT